MSMFSENEIFEFDYRTQLANANERNRDNLINWLDYAASWQDMVRNQWVTGTPLPPIVRRPAAVIRVDADYAARKITTTYGPDLVADGDLKPPEPPLPKPAGVAQRGVKIGYKMWACGQDDTMPVNVVHPPEPESGPTVTFDGKLHRKVGYEAPWAKDQMTVFYREL